jgi:hypothetical protein
MLLRRLARTAAMVLLLGTQSVHAQGNAASRVPQPVIEPARGEQCVEDPATMRRNHMTYLQHQRDDTMRGGIRGAKYSLQGCIDCHAGATTNSVAASNTNFCVTCHSYTAVRIDCFQCHASRPTTTSFLPLNHPGHGRSPLEQHLRDQVAKQQVKP